MTDILKKFLFDIKTSIDSIYIHLNNELDFNKYTTNLTRKRAVEGDFSPFAQ